MTPLTPAQSTLVSDNLDVARKTASFYCSRFPWARAHHDDILQEATLGLMYCAAKWAADGGATFRTYAYTGTHFYARHALRTLSRGGVSIPKAMRWEAPTVSLEDWAWEAMTDNTTRPADQLADAAAVVGRLESELVDWHRNLNHVPRRANAAKHVEQFVRVRFRDEPLATVGAAYDTAGETVRKNVLRVGRAYDAWLAAISNEATTGKAAVVPRPTPTTRRAISLTGACAHCAKTYYRVRNSAVLRYWCSADCRTASRRLPCAVCGHKGTATRHAHPRCCSPACYRQLDTVVREVPEPLRTEVPP